MEDEACVLVLVGLVGIDSVGLIHDPLGAEGTSMHITRSSRRLVGNRARRLRLGADWRVTAGWCRRKKAMNSDGVVDLTF